jgi:SPX domain protein involved in polyphosphate accumulation
MKYTYSEHYRENPYEEVDSALSNNDLESVQETFYSRLSAEATQIPQDAEAIERIQQQLEYLGSVALQSTMVA